MTALAIIEPVAGAQRKEAQSLQWFLSESRWDPKEVNQRRIELLFEESASAPLEMGVLVIDEHGDRKWGKVYEATFEAVLNGIKTADLGGSVGTTEFADEVIRHVRNKLEVWSALA